MQNKIKGFSLLELMISLTIGSIVLGLIFSTYASINKFALMEQIQSQLNQDGQLTKQILSNEIRRSGLFASAFDEENEINENSQKEEAWLKANPIVFGEVFTTKPQLTSLDGEGVRAASIALSRFGSRGCSGVVSSSSIENEVSFINQIYISGNTLKCRSYDLASLLGFRPSLVSNRSVSLMEGVEDLQIAYLTQVCSGEEQNPIHSCRSKWCNASEVSTLSQNNSAFSLAAVQVEFVLSREFKSSISIPFHYQLIGQTTKTITEDKQFRKFSIFVPIDRMIVS